MVRTIKKHLPWVRPRLLWAADLDARHLERPTMLCGAASPEELGRWRAHNRWADAVPLVAFGGDDMRSFGVPFGPPAGAVPWRVDNAPSILSKGFDAAQDTPYTAQERDSIGRYLTAVEAVATYAPLGPTWWICAESDFGLGAIRVAATRGACVALAAPGTSMGAMGAALANRLNVDVAVHDVGAGAPQ
jgi:hypothetical protein